MNLSAISRLEIKDKPVKKQKIEKVEPTVCRYYAIIAALDFGDYGSQQWQSAYLYYYNDCMGR